MKKWKYYTLILMIIIVFNICSCRRAEPENAAEEISFYNWILEADNGTGKITFDEGIMKLEFSGEAGADLKLSGEYHADEKNLYLDSDDGINIRFVYRLTDDKLFLKYSEREICFYKEQRKE